VLGFTCLGLLISELNNAAYNNWLPEILTLFQFVYAGLCFLVMFVFHALAVYEIYKLRKSGLGHNSAVGKRETKLLAQAALASFLVFTMWLTEFFTVSSDAVTAIGVFSIYEALSVLAHTISYAACDKKLRKVVRQHVLKMSVTATVAPATTMQNIPMVTVNNVK